MIRGHQTFVSVIYHYHRATL